MTVARRYVIAVGLAVCASLVAGTQVPSAAYAQKGKAKRLFKKGNKLLKKKKYDRAVAVYRRATRMAPRVGAIHVNLARAYVGAKQCGPALLHFRSYLVLKPKARDRDSINKERKKCVRSIGDVSRITIEVVAPEEPEEEESEEEEDTPEGLALVLNGAPIGDAPVTGLILGPGDYVLEATPPGGSVKTHEVRLSPAEGTEVLLTPTGDTAPALISFSVEPAGAEIHLDGKLLGKAPLEGTRSVSPGKHEVAVKDPSGKLQDWKGEVIVSPGAEEVVDIALEAHKGTLRVRAIPGALLKIDGEDRDPKDAIELAVGQHKIQVVAAHHHPWSGIAKVEAGKTTEVLAALVPLDTPLGGKRLAAYGVGGGALLAVVLGTVFGASASGQFDEIKARVGGGGTYATPSELDEIGGDQMLANVLFGVAVASAATSAALLYADMTGGGTLDKAPSELPRPAAKQPLAAAAEQGGGERP